MLTDRGKREFIYKKEPITCFASLTNIFCAVGISKQNGILGLYLQAVFGDEPSAQFRRGEGRSCRGTAVLFRAGAGGRPARGRDRRKIGQGQGKLDDPQAGILWMLEVETDKSYVQRANFKEYAVKIIKTLLDIAEGKQIEDQGYIYTIYSLVRGNTENPGIVLLSIVENTDMLITGLKNLNSSIKHYIDELTRYKTPAEIMDVLFNDYIENIVDKAYHRLLTSDKVSKLRPEIVERLESKSRSKSYMEKASADLAGIQE